MQNAPNRQFAAHYAAAPFAVCDEVRFERGGKHILIGAYPGNQIVLRSFPSLVTCTVWTAFFALKLGRLAGEYRAKNGQTIVASGEVAFNVTIIDLTECVLELRNFRLEAPAVVDVELRFSPEDWFSIGSFIVRRPTPEPNLPLFGSLGSPPPR